MNLLRETIKNLPSLPGVYRFLDVEKTVLYVGKARNLKKRVTFYFNNKLASSRIATMVKKISCIEITVTRSENEALLLESNLIKTLTPRYNIVFRDDKTYPYLKVTNHSFPRMVYYRGALDTDSHYFGPYPSAWAVKESISVMQIIFKLRVCEDGMFHQRTRPCLLYSIGRCNAPCVGKISQDDYNMNVEMAIGFLSGKYLKLMKHLEEKMQMHSINLDFEKAAVIRDQLSALARILQKQAIDIANPSDVDIIAVAMQSNKVCVTVAMVRGGRHLGDKAYFPRNFDQSLIFNTEDELIAVENLDDSKEVLSLGVDHMYAQVLQTFLLQYYVCRYVPNTLILSHPLLDRNFPEFFSRQHEKKINIILNPQSQRRIWLAMAKHNTELSLAKAVDEGVNSRESVVELIRVLQLNIDNPENLHIECFDVSHTNGEATQAACVVYQRYNMQRSAYRRYLIRDVKASDDYAALRQAIIRHYKNNIASHSYESGSHENDEIESTNLLNTKDSAFCMPNLVLVDGGKGQVEVARQIFLTFGYNISSIVGVAKGKNRHVGSETLIFADGRAPLRLGTRSMALMLIAKIRDEAHRFAITGMRAQRQKTRRVSRLEEIDGIGKKRCQRLLVHFGSLRGVQRASIEELVSVAGISQLLAESIYRHFH